MALLDNGLKVSTGVAVGLGAILLAPTVLPIIAAVARPLVKATIKGGIILYERGKELIAETAEVLEDLAAEAKAELAQAHEEAMSAVAPEQTE